MKNIKPSHILYLAFAGLSLSIALTVIADANHKDQHNSKDQKSLMQQSTSTATNNTVYIAQETFMKPSKDILKKQLTALQYRVTQEEVNALDLCLQS